MRSGEDFAGRHISKRSVERRTRRSASCAGFFRFNHQSLNFSAGLIWSHSSFANLTKISLDPADLFRSRARALKPHQIAMGSIVAIAAFGMLADWRL
jgi:hypothetical protein